ncbi:hypothetical protein Pmani_012474 [Petrolisthes manimaculis]|uniref:CCHC-type domain-containing protein n=1 Tax=Petrolisthes manimaculis TaxID=1843537 RepID=A0AAE1PYX5_9EUCA|nr:hypothetical protein Pmani_012474 [Petrolisthes manimaculis]
MADNLSKQNKEVYGITPDSSQQLPAREILIKTHKAELQKRCREMGLTNIWVKKDQLVDKILQNSHLIEKHADEQQETLSPANVPTPHPDNQLQLQLPEPARSPHPDNQLQLPEPARSPHPEASQPQNNNDTELLLVNNTSDDTQLFESDTSLLPLATTFLPEALDPYPIIASYHTGTTDITRDSLLNTTRHSIDNVTQSPCPPLDTSNNDQWKNEFMEKVTKDISTIMVKLETKDSEIELLNTEVKSAYSLIETLQQRIYHLETSERQDDKHEDGKVTTSSPSQCLFLGDTNLTHVRRSDLGDNCSVRTVTHANMDLLSSWVSEKLTWSPSHCVIYCGLYDVLDGKSPDSIYDNLGSLISNLKDKSSNVEICVCEIAPVLISQEVETRITDYNKNLVEWGKQNGVCVVKTVPALTLGSGETDDLCFEEENQIQLLNRLGIIKLLSTIDKQCNGFTLSKNWQKTKKNSSSLFNKLDKRDQRLPGSKHQYSGQNNGIIPNTSSSQSDVFQPHPKKMSSSTSYASILRNQAPLHRIDTGTPRWCNQVVQPQELDHHLTQEVTQEAPRQYRSSNVQRETLMYSPTAPVQREMQRCTETSLQRTSSRRGQEAMWEHNKRNHDSTSSPNFGDGYEGYWRDSRSSDGGKTTNQVSSTNLVTPPQRGWTHHPTPHHGPTTISTPTTTHQHTHRKMGCYNCGEFNHRRSTCSTLPVLTLFMARQHSPDFQQLLDGDNTDDLSDLETDEDWPTTDTEKESSERGNERMVLSFDSSSSGISDACSVTDSSNELDFLREFFSDELLDMIVIETNRYAQQYLRGNAMTPRCRLANWTDTTRD